MADPVSNASENQVAQHILRVAARLFARQGYDATPVRVIVEEAGVTKPSLYYHFGSKEGVAHALLTVPMNRLIEAFREIVASDAPAERAVGEFIEANFHFCREEPDRARFLYALFFGPLATGLVSEVMEFARGIDDLRDRLTDRLLSERGIDPEDFPRFKTALQGLIVIHTMEYLYKDVNLPRGLGHRLVRDLLQGFAPRGSCLNEVPGDTGR